MTELHAQARHRDAGMVVAMGGSFSRGHGDIAEAAMQTARRGAADTENPMSPHRPEMDACVDIPTTMEHSPSPSSRRVFLTTVVGTAAGTIGMMHGTVPAMAEPSSGDRFERGLQVLRRIGGETYDGPITRLAETSPDLARLTVEYPYGDILSRPGLDLRLRQLCTVAMLTAHGSAQPQLTFHMAGFLNAGGQPRALAELMFVSVAILGFPAAINGIVCLREVFRERHIAFDALEPATDDGTERHRQGLNALLQLTGGDAQGYVDGFAATSPELARWSIEFAFGEALSRDGLDVKAKLLAIIAMLGAAGNRPAALRLHLAGALTQGVTREEIIELLMQLSVYSGFPSALNAFGLAHEVFTDTGAHAAVVSPLPSAAAESRTARLERGRATLAKTSGASGDAVVDSFRDLAPDIGRMIVEHAYGEVFSREALDPKTRELTACAALAAVATTTAEIPLRVHIHAALNVGASRQDIIETLLNLVSYSGYPVVQQAVRIAGEEFAKRPD
jgi:4-carboxymuconolactone decarboxylase